MNIELVIKQFADTFFARTRKELKRDYDLACAKTVGVVLVRGYRDGIYATTFGEHARIIRDRAVVAWKQGLTEIVD